jgi:hypothetical protein
VLEGAEQTTQTSLAKCEKEQSCKEKSKYRAEDNATLSTRIPEIMGLHFVQEQ